MFKLYCLICVFAILSVIGSCFKIDYVARKYEISIKSRSSRIASLITIILFIFIPIINILSLLMFFYILAGMNNEEIKKILEEINKEDNQ